MKHFFCAAFVLFSFVGGLQAEETPAFIELKGHTGEINFANFSPDGKKVVTGGKDETVRIWDAETGKELRMLEGHRNRVDAALFSPDGKKIVTKDGRDFIRIWDAETGKMLHKLEEQVLQGGFGIYNPNPIAVFSPDSKKIFTAMKMSIIFLTRCNMLKIGTCGLRLSMILCPSPKSLQRVLPALC